jgi:uncharacterized membrane protein YcaP (DUF421 family)
VNELIGHSQNLGWVVAKAILMFACVVAGFRIAARRALTDLSIIDFVAAVAVGSIVGRVPNADDTSFLEGAITLAAVLLSHAAFSMLRVRWPEVIERSACVLVANGEIDHDRIRRCGLTVNDVQAALRLHGLCSGSEAAYVILEQRGRISVLVGAADRNAVDDLVLPVMR